METTTTIYREEIAAVNTHKQKYSNRDNIIIMNNNQYNSQANHDNRHWMIDLASLCESAARKDKAKVTSLLLLQQQQQQQQQQELNDDDNGLLRRHSNNNHHNYNDNDIQASTKLMNLIFGNYTHNDDDDTMYDILQYFDEKNQLLNKIQLTVH